MLTCTGKMLPLILLFVAATTFQGIAATPHAKPYEKWKRQSTATNATRVDLGYEVYEGSSNASTGVNSFKGYVL